ncbi:MAG: hypothetical protein KAS78_05065 [Candidatus Pacebacteria bacterium]|nr:hypothetical protein [Candidatus Paceibacterota bacterium]
MDGILKDLLDAATSLAVIFGVVFAYLQIKKVSKSIDINGKSNFIKVLGNFTKEYDTLMAEMIDCKTQKKIDVWYFRLWNLYTNEFVFFYQGILDPLIFEFWAFKLCLYYDKKPTKIPVEKIDTYGKSHLIYMKNRHKSYPKTDSFFHELIKIANKKNNEVRMEDSVHQLVERYRQFK